MSGPEYNGTIQIYDITDPLELYATTKYCLYALSQGKYKSKIDIHKFFLNS